MNWAHVKWIFQREVRDQLRDRRTMFTIFFLPLLLYPLMGMLMFEVAQFHRKNEVRVGLVGSENIPESFGFMSNGSNSQMLVKKLQESSDTSSLHATLKQITSSVEELRAVENQRAVEDLLRNQEVDIIAIVPPAFSEEPWKTKVTVISNQRWERSMVASQLFQEEWNRIHGLWLREKLETSQLGSNLLDAPWIESLDLSPPEMKRALIWSKILPFVLLVWALTGAFYPAIDLCAGEKERGTLETLLCSPARRREIVWGKLLTIICFSLGTALLNLASMYTTAIVVMGRFTQAGASEMVASLGPLPIHSLGWLILLVIPIAAMFSALALAVASLARSTKEGQYYLMPLLLVGLPLVMLPMIPGIQLSPGTSIIPITGAILLSRTLMDGEYMTGVLHLPTVLAVTVLCCLLAIRWAVRQFESESVMFRDSARSSLKHWIRDAWRQRECTPTTNESILCGLLILVCLFFGRLAMSSSALTWDTIVRSTLIIQIGMMLAPALIMATILTRSVTSALRLHTVRIPELAAVALLAVAMHPTYTVLASAISSEYKLGEETMALLQQFDGILANAPIGMVILVLGLIPAISEELVFRGFIFAGLERNQGNVRAILLSSILFGLSHGVLQQTISASVIGLVLGWIAYKTGGVACTIMFHFVHNSMSMLIAAHSSRGDSVPSWMEWAIATHQGRWAYTEVWCTLSVGVVISLLAWLAMQRHHKDSGLEAQAFDSATKPIH